MSSMVYAEEKVNVEIMLTHLCWNVLCFQEFHQCCPTLIQLQFDLIILLTIMISNWFVPNKINRECSLLWSNDYFVCVSFVVIIDITISFTDLLCSSWRNRASGLHDRWYTKFHPILCSGLKLDYPPFAQCHLLVEGGHCRHCFPYQMLWHRRQILSYHKFNHTHTKHSTT